VVTLFSSAEKKPTTGAFFRTGAQVVVVPHRSSLERLFDEEPGERQGDTGEDSEFLKHALSLGFPRTRKHFSGD
jgi:hypothetical protein